MSKERGEGNVHESHLAVHGPVCGLGWHGENSLGANNRSGDKQTAFLFLATNFSGQGTVVQLVRDVD